MLSKRDTESATILIADDHELVRDLVAGYLAAQGQFRVDTTGSLDEAIDRVRAENGYDIVMLDLGMPGMNGLQGLTTMLAENAAGKVVMFSGATQRDVVLQAIRLGASGYVPKNLPAKSLINAIQFVLSGETYVPPSQLADPQSPAAAPEKNLSPKELIVLRGVRAGWMNKQIAYQMGLSEVTVKMHVRSICKKLNARNRTHAAIIANMLDLDQESGDDRKR